MSLAVAGRKRHTVQTAHHLAECHTHRKWRLRQETIPTANEPHPTILR